MLVRRLVEAGAVFRGNACRCPFHDDRRASAGVYERNGKWRFHCHACGVHGDLHDIQVLLLSAGGRGTFAPPIRSGREVIASSPARQFSARIEPADVSPLARQLGVSAESLRRLGVGRLGRYWAVPMQDAEGRITGVRLRDGSRKLAVRGSKNGLFVPRNLSDRSPLLIVEGESDCAAALDLGFDAIGRPGCMGYEALVVAWLDDREYSEAWIVADRDSEHQLHDGRRVRPGVDGAYRLAEALPVACRVIVPPVKDLRQWVAAGATRAAVESLARHVREVAIPR